MNDRPSVEITADTIEEAVAQGLAQLGVTSSDVIVEVLEEPSRGVFGIGARQARVRLQLFRRYVPPPAAPTPPPPRPPEKRETRRETPEREPRRESSEREPRREPRREKDKPKDRPRGGDRKASHDRKPRERNRDREQDEVFSYSEDFDAYAFAADVQDEVSGEDSDIAREVLTELLQNMGFKAVIRVTQAASQPGENTPYLLNIEGQRLDPLIGRRGETLAALQYITRLIASRRLGRRANVVLDIGGYKARRSQKLRELAIRMADQAAQDKRTMVLEPMPPHERRMIHMTLRHRTDVFTKSVGEGNSRKVTIVPK